MVVKIEYPNGSIKHFLWINTKTGFGYFRKGKKIYRYTLPKKYQKPKSNESIIQPERISSCQGND